jgi:hypothetical protein
MLLLAFQVGSPWYSHMDKIDSLSGMSSDETGPLDSPVAAVSVPGAVFRRR